MKKLLIVEDNQVIASIYRAKFQAEGFEVEVAADGAVGLEMINRIRPDAVVLDQMLPNLTGLEVLRRVRAEPALQSLPIFIFSNSMIGSMVQEAWASEATEVLTKATHTPKQVVEVVKKALTAFASSSTSSIVTPPAPETTSLGAAHEPDARGQSGFQKNSVNSLPQALTALQESHSVFTKNASDAALLLALHARVHAVVTQAIGASGLPRFSKLAAALETLLKELHEKPKCVNSSVIRTLSQSISYLTPLFERSSHGDEKNMAPTCLLVVDEDVARRAVSYALGKEGFRLIRVGELSTALKILVENSFDLVVLNIEMAGTNNFEFCAKLRAMPLHVKTPIVFTTELADFERDLQPGLSNGGDLIAKPFLSTEMLVKVLTLLPGSAPGV